MSFLPNIKFIQELVQRRLINVHPSVKTKFPEVLRESSFMWIPFGNDLLMGVLFVRQQDIHRVTDFQRQTRDPFPGLFTTHITPAAFRFDQTRFGVVDSVNIRDSIAFSIGQDCTFFVTNLKQEINTSEAGRLTYTLPLGYFVSFGKEIIADNIHEYLDELVAYSVKTWTGR